LYARRRYLDFINMTQESLGSPYRHTLFSAVLVDTKAEMTLREAYWLYGSDGDALTSSLLADGEASVGSLPNSATLTIFMYPFFIIVFIIVSDTGLIWRSKKIEAQ
jgi:hypothetical protein